MEAEKRENPTEKTSFKQRTRLVGGNGGSHVKASAGGERITLGCTAHKGDLESIVCVAGGSSQKFQGSLYEVGAGEKGGIEQGKRGEKGLV